MRLGTCAALLWLLIDCTGTRTRRQTLIEQCWPLNNIVTGSLFSMYCVLSVGCHYCRPLIIGCCGCSLLPLIGWSLPPPPLRPCPRSRTVSLSACIVLFVVAAGGVSLAHPPRDASLPVFLSPVRPKNKLTCRIFTLTISGRYWPWPLDGAIFLLWRNERNERIFYIVLWTFVTGICELYLYIYTYIHCSLLL